jgi:hypothetical protein
MAEPKTNDTPVEKKKRSSKKKANAHEPKLETKLWAAAATWMRRSTDKTNLCAESRSRKSISQTSSVAFE